MEGYRREPFLYAKNSRLEINAQHLHNLLKIRPTQLFEPHKISFYVVQLFLRGEGTHTVDFNTFEVKERHILFLTPNQINQFHYSKYEACILIFTQEFFVTNDTQEQFFGLSRLFNDPLRLTYFDLGGSFDEIHKLFELIENELAKEDCREKSILLNNYLFSMLLLADRNYAPDTDAIILNPQKRLVAKFKSIANRDINKDYNINEYAQKMNISIRTLQKAFAEEEKQTPNEWLADRMILEIKRNLINRNAKISDIAYSLGFKELSHFTKFFKSKTGLTPSEFKQSIL